MIFGNKPDLEKGWVLGKGRETDRRIAGSEEKEARRKVARTEVRKRPRQSSKRKVEGQKP